MRSIREDAAWLEALGRSSDAAAQAKALIELPLWLSDVRGDPKDAANLPPWARAPLDRIANDPELREAGFDHWIAWYRGIIPDQRSRKPTSHFGEALDIRIATQPDEWWKRGPEEVNRNIAEWMKGTEREAVGQPDSIPPQVPASVRPVWRSGRLVQSRTAMETDVREEITIASLASLADEFGSLANDAGRETNVDRRVCAYIAEFSERIPTESLPDSTLLFWLCHREALFYDYLPTSRAEWPSFLYLRLASLLGRLTTTLDQFADRREFGRRALELEIEAVEIQPFQQEVVEVTTLLRSPSGSEVVDDSVPAMLASISDSAPSLREGSSSATMPEGLIRSVAADQLESINNIAKALATGDPDASDAAMLFEEGRSAYAEEFVKTYVSASREAGAEDAKEAAKAANRAAVAHVAAHTIWNRIKKRFPKAFSWMPDDGKA